MKIREIAELSDLHENIHASVFRSYQVLQKAKELLHKGTPSEVVLELIEVMEAE